MKRILYLTAQPAETYFFWQLELQLRNFASLCINPNDIHVLVAYDPTVGILPELSNFVSANEHLASIFIYPDNRVKKVYPSSIRPHILKQHFLTKTDLAKQVIFYLDSDVLFSRVPLIPSLFENDTCYVSDTRSYIDTEYILRQSSLKLLTDMASIVGVDLETLYKNDLNSGGAQYLLKDISHSFWEKVESDSESLFEILNAFNKQKRDAIHNDKGTFNQDDSGIQAWCADMWSVLWNLHLEGKTTQIHSELDFCWADDPIGEWKNKAILHYTGNKSIPNIFNKTRYLRHAPWYDRKLRDIDEETCSIIVVDQIKKRKKELDSGRIDLRNITMIIVLASADVRSLMLLETMKAYILKYFDCPIISYIEDERKYLNLLTWDAEPVYKKNVERPDSNPLADNYIAWSVNHFVGKRLITEIVDLIPLNTNDIIKFVPHVQLVVDLIFEQYIPEFLDEDLLDRNIGKLHSSDKTGNGLYVISKNLFHNFSRIAEAIIDLRDLDRIDQIILKSSTLYVYK